CSARLLFAYHDPRPPESYPLSLHDALPISGAVTFTGYDQISGEATVLGLLVNGVPVPSAGAGTEVDLVLDRTPFYAEGGGQLARSEEHTSELQSRSDLVCRLLLEKKKTTQT